MEVLGLKQPALRAKCCCTSVRCCCLLVIVAVFGGGGGGEVGVHKTIIRGWGEKDTTQRK